MLERHMRSPRNLTINDVFYSEAGTGNGVFSSLENPPWNEDINSDDLNYAYHFSRSGEKFASPFLYRLLNPNTGVITPIGFSMVGRTLMASFGQKWSHLYDLYKAEYNPLHSYEITETRERELQRDEDVTDTRTPDISAARTINLSDVQTHPTKTTTVESTRTPDLSEATTVSDDSTIEENSTKTTTHGHVVTTESDNEGTTSNNRYGFNTASEDGVPSTKSTVVGSNDTTETNSGEDEDATIANTSTERDTSSTTLNTGTEDYEETSIESYTGQDILAKSGSDTTRTTGTDANVHDGSIGESESIELTRSGNLFKSPSELMSIDRDFWMTPFWEIVFEDIDSILTLKIYSERPIYNKIY